MGEIEENGVKGKQEVFTLDTKLPEKDEDGGAKSFEEALDLTGTGRYNWIIFITCNITLIAMALEIFGTSYIITASACDLEMTTEIKGLVSAMPMMSIIVSAHLWGWLADTRGRRTVLLLSMFGGALFGIASSLATAWQAMAFFKFLSGFFASASNAVTYALLGESTSLARRDKLVMMITSGLMFTQGIMTICAYPVLGLLHFDVPLIWGLRYRPWRLLQQIFSGWCTCSALLLLFLVKESPKFYASRGQERNSLKVMAQIFAVNTGKMVEDYPVKSLIFDETQVKTKDSNLLHSMWVQTVPIFRPPLLAKTAILIYIVIVVYAISPAVLMWTPSIMSAYSRASATGARNSSFCQLIHLATKPPGNSTGETLAPVCNDRIEDLTYISTLIFSASCAILNLINSLTIKCVGKRALVILYHLIGGGCGILLPFVSDASTSLAVFFLFQINLVVMGLTTGFTVEIYPTYLRAMAVCLTMMIGRGVSFLFITYLGVLLESQCEHVFYAFGAVMLSGAIVGLLLPSEKKT